MNNKYILFIIILVLTIYFCNCQNKSNLKNYNLTNRDNFKNTKDLQVIDYIKIQLLKNDLNKKELYCKNLLNSKKPECLYGGSFVEQKVLLQIL